MTALGASARRMGRAAAQLPLAGCAANEGMVPHVEDAEQDIGEDADEDGKPEREAEDSESRRSASPAGLGDRDEAEGATNRAGPEEENCQDSRHPPRSAARGRRLIAVRGHSPVALVSGMRHGLNLASRR